MGDAHLLHSSSSSISSQYSQHLGSAWDLHNNLEIFNTGLSLVRESRWMTGSTPPRYYGSTTGYLEDALLVEDHYTPSAYKRRRPSLLYHQIPNNLCNSSGGYRWWVNESDHDNNLNCITQSMLSASASDEVGIVKGGSSNIEEESAAAAAAAGGVTLFQEAVTTKLETRKLGLIDETPCSNSSSLTTCNHLLPPANNPPSSASGESSSSSRMARRRKRSKVIKGLVYPFEVVKRGGEEGEVTLKDINERMVMPPTRPVPHPVGHYACPPRYYGPGLSGNPVVALTTIHTQGRRGTITLITTTPS